MGRQGELSPRLGRPAAEISTPEALSAFKASRLSFLRVLIARMARERWRITTQRFDLDDAGRGVAVYRIETADAPLHFVVFSDVLEESQRTDRIIANHYEGEAILCFGDVTPERIAAQRGEFADFLYGRADIETLGWTRVNRCGRIFDHVVDALAGGRQPDIDRLMGAGYLLRNNGYWGNGRHGSASFAGLPAGSAIAEPYHADLLTLYMWRHFSHDLVDHIAARRGGGAVSLHPALKRYLGVGNASGLGLIPFVIRHPQRIHNWCAAREAVIARAQSMPADAAAIARLADIVTRAIAYYKEGVQVRAGIFAGSARLAADLARIAAHIESQGDALSWPRLCEWAAGSVHPEALETLHSALIELYPDLCDEALAAMRQFASPPEEVHPEQPAAELLDVLEARYGWALAIDRNTAQARRHFWYLSADNLEPRHGVRGVDPMEAYETFVDVAGAMQALHCALRAAPPGQTLGRLLFARPDLRHAAARAQASAEFDYGEVRANIIGADFEPCHLIRFLLTSYGMEKLDPQSRLWVRGTFLQGAPLAGDISAGNEGDWIYPPRPVLD